MAAADLVGGLRGIGLVQMGTPSGMRLDERPIADALTDAYYASKVGNGLPISVPEKKGFRGTGDPTVSRRFGWAVEDGESQILGCHTPGRDRQRP